MSNKRKPRIEQEEIPRYVPFRLEEPDVIAKLVEMVRNPRNGSRYGIFSAALCSPFEPEDYSEYTGFYIAQQLDRKVLGLPGDRKPGDIDLLAIPYKEHEILYERAAAYEVKVVRPSRQNMKRRPNSFGTKQIMGYIEDGFPFVSCVHISMTEPLLEGELQQIPLILQEIGNGDVPPDAPPLDAFEMIGTDWFPFFAQNNHMRRMISMNIPKYVGLIVEGWNMDSEGTLTVSSSQEYTRFEGCFWNPNRRKETVELIAAHHAARPECYEDIRFNKVAREPDDELVAGVQPIVPDTDENGNPNNGDNAPFKIQSFSRPTQKAFLKGVSESIAELCLPVLSSGMDDGSAQAIKKGDFIFANDLGTPVFEELPTFRPIAFIRLIGGKPAHLIGVITKKHAPSQIFRFSFYNPSVSETWIRYSTVKQVFEIIHWASPDELDFRELDKDDMFYNATR